jgi:3-hydroxybutyrate dehydrogenase
MNILVTGAGSGLGRGLCLHWARTGHHLILADRNAAALRETMQLMGPAAERATAHEFDVASATQVRGFLQALGDQPLHVLINDAGLQHVARLEEFPEDRWDQLVEVMLKGPFLLTRALLPRMRAVGFGRIINIGSIHSLVASPFKSAYVAAKHAMLGFSKVVALETADVDITINTICPAYIRTPLVEAQIHAQAQTRGIPEQEILETVMLEPMPKKRFITIEEVAATAEFLMSAHARNITGQTIVIDGGWTAR